jgi:hypothetical protein
MNVVKKRINVSGLVRSFFHKELNSFGMNE